MARRRVDGTNGSATAEIVVALPIVITLALIGVRFLGETVSDERLQFIAEGVVQAVMRDESSVAIQREISKTFPGAHFTIVEDSQQGRFTVTLHYRAESVSADGYR